MILLKVTVAKSIGLRPVLRVAVGGLRGQEDESLEHALFASANTE